MLGQRSEELAKANPRVKASELAGQLNTGFTAQLIRLTADLKGVTIKEVLDDLAKTIQEAQLNIKAIEAGEKARAES